MATLRDRFWLFTVVAGADGKWLEAGGIKTPSRMTPAEGAFYLDIPNLIMVRSEGRPAHPFDQYAISFRPLKQVVWSIVGSGGKTAVNEADLVLDLASRFPNITGVMMDDFFRNDGKGNIELDRLGKVRDSLVVNGRRLNIWVVTYTHMLNPTMKPYLELCDVVTLWTWNSDNLKDLESNFRRLEEIAGQKRKALGCYMWDYFNKKPMPIPLMEKQCSLGLQWIMEGRLDEMIFLANTVCDLGFDVVEWTRQWIENVGGRTLAE